jgi:hypothetical protein
VGRKRIILADLARFSNVCFSCGSSPGLLAREVQTPAAHVSFAETAASPHLSPERELHIDESGSHLVSFGSRGARFVHSLWENADGWSMKPRVFRGLWKTT